MAKEIKFTVKLNVNGEEKLVTATTSVRQLRDMVDASKSSAAKLRDELLTYNQTVQVMQSLSFAISQISGTLSILTEESRAFSTAMKSANTMAGKDAAGFERLKGQVAELSKSIPMARDALANGLYQVISNGVPEDNWISYLETSAKSAIGGIADVGEVVKVTSTIIKNYGLSWDAAQDIQDKIQLTAKNGVTSFEQLAAALPSVTGQAAQLGVSFSEMLAVMSTLTGVTGNTADVSTQLASVLTALTKESSKSQKMAEAMGIEFNAASIKAAGGLRNYLQELDKTVTAYAAKSGELKESIYSKLFGRAEALRLVNALTGQMAEKFDENIAALDASAGTMAEAYDTMASTGEAKLRLLRNQWAKYTDYISKAVGGILPYLNFGSQMGMSIVSVLTLTRAFKQLNVIQKLTRVETFRTIAAYALFGTNTRKVAAATHVMAQSFRSARTAAIAAKIAIRGLMAATGIGLALVAVTGVISALAGAFDKAGDSAREAADGLDEFGKEADTVKEAYDNTLNSTYADLMSQFEGLKQSWKALSTEAEKMAWIKEHQSAFDSLRFEINSVSDAEAIFSGNTDAVVEAFTRRAKAAARMAQLTELYRKQIALADEYATTQTAIQDDANKHGRHAKAGDEIKDSSYHNSRYGKVNRAGKWEFTEEGARLYSGTDVSASPVLRAIDKRMQANDAEIKKVEAQFASENAEANKILKPGKKKVIGDADKKGDKKAHIVADPKTLDELRTNIDLTKKKLTDADTEEQRKLREQIKLWQKKADAIELSQKKAALPAGVFSETNEVDVTKIETETDAKAVIDYLNALKQVAATKKELSDIDKQVAAVELRQAEIQRPDAGVLKSLLGNTTDETIKVNVEQGSVDLPEVPADDKVIKVNVEQGSVDLSPLEALQAIDKELEYQRALRKTAAAEQQTQIDAMINQLETLRKHVENAGVIKMDNSALQNYDQLNTKLSYYRDLLNTAMTSERPKILQHIKDLEEIESRWQKADKAATINVNPADLSTLKELGEAISYLQERQQTETAPQAQVTQIDIGKLQEKQKAIQLSVEIPSMQKEVDEIQALTGREYKLRIKGMGFDSLIDRVRDLNTTLNNPNLGKEQRAQLIRLRDSYADFARDAMQSFSTYRQGWEGIKGVGNGIQGISDALEGNGNAWQKATAVIDGFLQICDGISAVVEMVKMLTMATELQTIAKTEETTSTTANTAAVAAETTATTANTLAATANTAAKSGEAIAGATASGASMPFPYNLIAIAAGVAAVIAALAQIGSFATGGVVGGNSPTGDRLFARVNSGEMILNKRQQQRLLYILNGGAFATGLTPVMPKPQRVDLNLAGLQSQLQPIDIHVHGSLKGRGRDLLATIENEQNHNKRS